MPPPDRWLVLTVDIGADDPFRDLVAEGLLVLGGRSVLDEAGSLTTYLDPPADPEAFAVVAQRTLGDLVGSTGLKAHWRWQPNEDWEREWRRGLQARQVSPRVVVKPSWTEWEGQPSHVVIEIDPQMAFGTGEHPTTRGCLRLIDRLIEPGDRALDIGSGSAILAIAAARLGAREVVAIEYDPDANINARENLARNDAEGVVTLWEEMADAGLIARLGPFDLVLANILSGVIRPLLPALSMSLSMYGRLIVSGILIEERTAVMDDAVSAGLQLIAEDQEEGWWSGALENRQE